MRLLLKFFLAELACGLLVLLGFFLSQRWLGWELWGAVAWGGVGLAVLVGLPALGVKAWAMRSKTLKPIQRGLGAVLLSMLFRTFALALGLIWAVKAMHAPGTFLLGFLCVYAMQLILEVGYLVLEQKQQSLPQRENG